MALTPHPLPSSRLPDPTSILVELSLAPRAGVRAAQAAPAGAIAATRYRILRTLEVDLYDSPVLPSRIMDLARPRRAPGPDEFRGRARKAAKLSISAAPMETHAHLGDLIATLVAHDRMATHSGIHTDEGNGRVPEEDRNVRVRAFLYAASRENDNDYHLIIGRDPSEPELYMTVEVSGLPPRDSPHRPTLEAVRIAHAKFFDDGLPGETYDFYDPPIPIEIEGSLFFDASHASGSRPGPSRLRPHMPVVWELHPVTKIVFEP